MTEEITVKKEQVERTAQLCKERDIIIPTFAQQKDPDVDVDQLVVAAACVDDAPGLKRIRHAAMGRVFRIVKRACHVTIDLDLGRERA